MLARFLASIVFALMSMEMCASEKETSLVRNSFDKLLHNLARLNEARLISLKKNTQLQDHVVNNGILESWDSRDGGGIDEKASHDEDQPALLEILQNLVRNKLSHDHPSGDENEVYIIRSAQRPPSNADMDNIEHPQTNSEENNATLRRELPDAATLRSDWRRPCDKSAMKNCIQACRNAVKNVCSTYKCSRRAKKRFKTECKRSCRSKFMSSGRYSDSEYDYYTDY